MTKPDQPSKPNQSSKPTPVRPRRTRDLCFNNCDTLYYPPETTDTSSLADVQRKRRYCPDCAGGVLRTRQVYIDNIQARVVKESNVTTHRTYRGNGGWIARRIHSLVQRWRARRRRA